MKVKLRNEPTDVLYRIKRGLVAYVSYLAACEMNEAFSEYVLYEPILRIFISRGYSVRCECEGPGINHAARGDRKRIDFIAKWKAVRLGLEVKWARQGRLDVKRDCEKLAALRRAYPEYRPFLCVFGRKSDVEHIRFVNGSFTERGKIVCADLRRTKYACRIFELNR